MRNLAEGGRVPRTTLQNAPAGRPAKATLTRQRSPVMIVGHSNSTDRQYRSSGETGFMPRPLEIIDSVDTPDGRLQLLRLREDEWEIMIDRRTLMSSRYTRSEIALGKMACEPLAAHRSPRVIVSGLGMGYTLRAVLDVLPLDAEVLVAEINPVVVDWCRWRLAALCDDVLDDPRVQLEIVDVGVPIARAASGEEKDRLDAIVLDLYEGPYAVPAGQEDPLFGHEALTRARAALRTNGCLAVWSEQSVASFERRLKRAGFRVQCRRPRHKGPRHVVYMSWPIMGADRQREVRVDLESGSDAGSIPELRD